MELQNGLRGCPRSLNTSDWRFCPSKCAIRTRGQLIYDTPSQGRKQSAIGHVWKAAVTLRTLRIQSDRTLNDLWTVFPRGEEVEHMDHLNLESLCCCVQFRSIFSLSAFWQPRSFVPWLQNRGLIEKYSPRKTLKYLKLYPCKTTFLMCISFKETLLPRHVEVL